MRQAPDGLRVALYESGEQPGRLHETLSRLGWTVQQLPLKPALWTEADVDLGVVALGSAQEQVAEFLEDLAHRVSMPLLLVLTEEQSHGVVEFVPQLQEQWPARLDVLVAPFSQTEVRLRATLLMSPGPAGRSKAPHTLGALHLDRARQQASAFEKPLVLSHAQYLIVEALAESDGRALSKRVLSRLIHGSDEFDENLIQSHVRHIRSSFEQAGLPAEAIQTVRSVGYLLDTAVLQQADSKRTANGQQADSRRTEESRLIRIRAGVQSGYRGLVMAPRRVPMRLISLGLFTLTLALVLAGGYDFSPRIGGITVTTAPVDGADVYHLKSKRVSKAPGGFTLSTSESEYWLDPATQDTRHEVKNSDDTSRVVYLRKGRTLIVYFPKNNQVFRQTYTDENNPALQYVQRQVLHYQDVVARGRVKRVGTDVVEGRRAAILESTVQSEGVELVEQATVDEQTGLPLEITTYREGGTEEVSTESISYQLTERVPRSQVPAAVFADPVAHDDSTRTYLTQNNARRFGEFGVYWPGPTWGDTPLDAIMVETTLNGDLPGRATTIELFYADPSDADGDLQISERPVSQAPPGCGGGAPARKEMAGRRQVTLCDQSNDNLMNAHLVIDGTYIIVSGDTRDEVLRAAESLEKLN